MTEQITFQHFHLCVSKLPQTKQVLKVTNNLPFPCHSPKHGFPPIIFTLMNRTTLHSVSQARNFNVNFSVYIYPLEYKWYRWTLRWDGTWGEVRKGVKGSGVKGASMPVEVGVTPLLHVDKFTSQQAHQISLFKGFLFVCFLKVNFDFSLSLTPSLFSYTIKSYGFYMTNIS